MIRLRFLVVLAVMALAGCSGTDLVNGLTTSFGVQPVTTARYAPGPRGLYDVYRPARETRPGAPVVVFFYGGSWQEGDRGLYPFLGESLAKAGFTTVIPDYRLSPAVSFPAFVDDGANAVRAAIDKVAGDRPVVLMGHSAGAHIAALLAYDARYLRRAGVDRCRRVAGVVGLAGPYDFLPLTKPDIKRVFPPRLRPQSQPIAFAGGAKPPSLLLHGRDDTTVHAEDSTLMGAALRRSGSQAAVKLYDGVDHIEIMGAMAPLFTGLAPTRSDVLTWLDGLTPDRRNHCDG